MNKLFSLFLCLILLSGSACAAEFDGTVIARETVSAYSPYGGVISHTALKQGEYLHVGDEIARMNTTHVLATEDGTIRGVFADEGDSAAGTVLYLAPVSKFTIACSIDHAYDSAAAKYVTIGETVYIKCAPDSTHKAIGVITAVNGSDYTVQTTAGELYMEEAVYLYRSPAYKAEERIGRGTVSRTESIPLTARAACSSCTWRMARKWSADSCCLKPSKAISTHWWPLMISSVPPSAAWWPKCGCRQDRR